MEVFCKKLATETIMSFSESVALMAKAKSLGIYKEAVQAYEDDGFEALIKMCFLQESITAADYNLLTKADMVLHLGSMQIVSGRSTNLASWLRPKVYWYQPSWSVAAIREHYDIAVKCMYIWEHKDSVAAGKFDINDNGNIVLNKLYEDIKKEMQE